MKEWLGHITLPHESSEPTTILGCCGTLPGNGCWNWLSTRLRRIKELPGSDPNAAKAKETEALGASIAPPPPDPRESVGIIWGPPQSGLWPDQVQPQLVVSNLCSISKLLKDPGIYLTVAKDEKVAERIYGSTQTD
jgi:hypothetical protein